VSPIKEISFLEKVNRLARRVRHSPTEFRHRVLYERPDRAFRRELLDNRAESSLFIEYATALDREGLVIIEDYFSGELLARAQEDFQRFCARFSSDSNGEIRLDRNYLSQSEALVEMAFDNFLLDLIRFAWGKPIFLAETGGYRILPIELCDYSSFQWHHDNKRKQIKMMVLLTDVAADGQRMDYIPKTQDIWHQHYSSEETRISPAVAERFGPNKPCHGPAGSVVLFNTNGIHRGNRNKSTTRDVWVNTYTAGDNLFPVPLFSATLRRRLNKQQLDLIRR
jgi:hypothetical protein